MRTVEDISDQKIEEMLCDAFWFKVCVEWLQSAAFKPNLEILHRLMLCHPESRVMNIVNKKHRRMLMMIRARGGTVRLRI